MTTTNEKFTYELDTMQDYEWEFHDNRVEVERILEASEVLHYHISGRGMTWERLDGWIVVKWYDVLKALAINGDYRLVISGVEGEPELTAVRYSHDEPVGASFTIRPATYLEALEAE